MSNPHIEWLKRFKAQKIDRHFEQNAQEFQDLMAGAAGLDDRLQASYEQRSDHINASHERQQSEADRIRQVIEQHKARLSEFE